MKKQLIHSLWLQGMGKIIGILVYVCAIALLFTAILYVLRRLWLFYASTPAAGHYITIHGAPHLIRVLITAGIPALALKTTLIVLLVSMSGAAFTHLFSLSSYLYWNRGRYVRILLWGLPLTWLSALIMQETGLTDSFQIAFSLALLPSMGLFSRCFSFAYDMMPELDLFLTPYPRLSGLWGVLHHSLALILLSSILSVMVLYLLEAVLETQAAFTFPTVFRVESARWGDIPFDLSEPDRIKLSLELTFTVFIICAGLAVIARLTNAVRYFSLLQYPTVNACVFGPVLRSALRVGHPVFQPNRTVVVGCCPGYCADFLYLRPPYQ